LVYTKPINGLIIVSTSNGVTAHPHPGPPLEREGEIYLLPLQGEIERGMGLHVMSILL
jgi:hypothetical protein